VIIEGERIAGIEEGFIDGQEGDAIIEAKGKFLLPGAIDDQVHFREPGMTHKEDIRSGSIAALAGGVTTFMEMPNTKPPTIDRERLEEKFAIAEKGAAVNHSFYIGATADNIDLIREMDPKAFCGIKIFLAASTSDLLFDDGQAMEELFSKCQRHPIDAHCEDENIIRNNLERYRRVYGKDIPMRFHPLIRSHEACYRSSSYAVRRARELGARLNVLHISTGKETELFEAGPVLEKRVTSEACVHHLFFDESDYAEKGSWIKWNPAIKSARDRERILEAVNEDRIDLIATDHAPHTEEEKAQNYFDAPAGAPLVQHGLTAMFELYRKRRIPLQKIVEKMCHNPADLFGVKERGYVREGYYADLVLLDPDRAWTVRKENLFYKCGWSPLEGERFHGRISHTFVNGTLAYRHEQGVKGEVLDSYQGKRIEFLER
jgi:dihydroorotase